VLSETDTLLHACYQALHSVRVQPFGWAADAYLILRKRADLAWTELLESANLSRTALPLSVALDYLARELDAPIPEAIRERLATETADPLERDVALLASRRGGGLRVRSLLASPAPLRHRLTVLRWLVLPSRRYLEWVSGAPLRRGLARLYLERAGRYLARRAARRLRRGAPTPGTGVRGAQRGARLPAETV
jgi:hypothetical protein